MTTTPMAATRTPALMVALTAALTVFLTLASASTANAANNDGNGAGFRKPTSLTYLGARCVKVGHETWDVTARFRVSGGRYANLGNPARGVHYNDNVFRGGRRTILSTTRYTGWPSDDMSEPVETRFTFQQMVAPVKKQRDRSTWVNIYKRPVINLACG